MSAPSVAGKLRLSEALDAFQVSKVRADGSKVSDAEANLAAIVVLEAVRRHAAALNRSEARVHPEKFDDLVSVIVSKVWVTPLLATLLDGAQMPSSAAELDALDAKCGAYLKTMLTRARIDGGRKNATDPLAMQPKTNDDTTTKAGIVENVSPASSPTMASGEADTEAKEQAEEARELVDKLFEETLQNTPPQHHDGYRESYGDIWALRQERTTFERVVSLRAKVERSPENEVAWITARNAVQQRHSNLRKAMERTLKKLVQGVVPPTKTWEPGELALLEVSLKAILLRRRSSK